jgi:hypothetical protein
MQRPLEWEIPDLHIMCPDDCDGTECEYCEWDKEVVE